MATFDYDKIQDKAQKILKKYGINATLKKYEMRISTVPWEPAGRSLSEEPCVGIIGEYTKWDYENTSVERGDIRFYVSPKGLSEINKSDLISIQGKDYQVVYAKPTAPGGVDLLVDVQLRR